MDYAAAALPPPRVTHNYGGVQGHGFCVQAFPDAQGAVDEPQALQR